MDVRRALVLCVLLGAVSAESASAKSRSCAAFRQFYTSKGFSLSGVPQAQISGEHLRVCPQGYTCCTSQVEENLSNLSRKEFEDQVKESGHNLQVSLNSHYKSFDGYFQDLLNRSEASLHNSLQSIFGTLFSQNAQVFQDLYSDLRHYYRGSKMNLAEALNDFWARLLERLVRGLNGRYSMSEDYLDCVAKQAETLRPFGETIREFKLKVTRTFVAARSFVQGLVVAGEVVRKVSQVPLSVECVRALMKQTYCPHCREMAWAKPCTPYCRNVMKGCLANQADLDTEWKNLADSMLLVADRLSRPNSVDTIILSLPKRIADAIMYMQDNLYTFNSKVFQACGTPPENPSPEEPKKTGKIFTEDISSTSAESAEKLLSDASRKIRSMMQYWVQLPNKLCVDREAKSSDENKCWNGMAIDRYLPEVMGDGLANQINNPEVEIDITKPDIIIRQQIMQLKIMTSRMKNAINGNDVDFQDASDDISGSGSGMCNDDQCFHNQQIMVRSTRRPRVYPNPPVKMNEVKDDGRRILPCSALCLLSLATVLLRR
ncbi:glypican-1b [Neoarius graeffei]|uniref:glypican-1b n=1 Tax=Neoarius graeffei TaxID=443677 RepID=UPI00298C667B|nr:glypican-1b [Neoarius graeffei]